MPAIVALVIALAVLLVIIRVLQRRRQDEIRSIHHYHDRLDTLHVEPHDRGGSVRLVHGEEPEYPHVEPHRPRLDPESAHLDTGVPPGRSESRSRHGRDWALERMEPRARVDTATALVVAIVVAVLVAIALAGYVIQRGRGSSPTTTTTTTVPTSPTTTAPTSYVTRTTSGSVAIYVLPSGAYTVTVSGVDGPVWASATSPPTSAHADGRLVARGTSSSFELTGPSRVLLGAPQNAAVTLNGVPVVFPSPLPAPLSLQFSAPR